MKPRPTFIERRRVIHRPNSFSDHALHDHRSPGIAWLPVLHRGARAEQLAHEHSDVERVFMRLWEEENDPHRGHRGQILPALLDDQPHDLTNILWTRPPKVSQRDAHVAATVIQWLGSNVGHCFLVRALREAGYRVDGDERRARDRTRTEPLLRSRPAPADAE